MTLVTKWWNTAYEKRRRLTIDNSSQVIRSLEHLPLAVKLTTSRIDYDFVKSAGEDIRFVLDDQSTVLNHEFDIFVDDGNTDIWVEVPSILMQSQNFHIWMYYGAPGASALPSPATENAIWDNAAYDAVWHFSEDPSGGAPQLQDSTSNNNDLTSEGSMTGGDLVDGQMGKAWDFDGSDDGANNTSFMDGVGPSVLQLEALVNTSQTQQQIVFSRGVVDDSWEFGLDDDAKCFFQVDDGTFYVATGTTVLSDGAWHYIVGVWDGSNLRVYVDGVLEDTTAFGGPWPGQGAAGTFQCAQGIGGGNPFSGKIGEGRVMIDTWKFADYFMAQYLSIFDEDYITYGDEESADKEITIPSPLTGFTGKVTIPTT